MKQLTFAVTSLLLCISVTTSLPAAKVEVEGKAWHGLTPKKIQLRSM